MSSNNKKSPIWVNDDAVCYEGYTLVDVLNYLFLYVDAKDRNYVARHVARKLGITQEELNEIINYEHTVESK